MYFNARTTALFGLAALVSAHAATPLLAHSPSPTKAPIQSQAQMMSLGTSGTFAGPEVKKGQVEIYRRGNTVRLRATGGFEIPKAPAPTWQVVDNAGNVFTLQQLNIVGGKTNLDIALPSYITSVSSVRVWCSFAEVNLGEAKFAKALMLK